MLFWGINGWWYLSHVLAISLSTFHKWVTHLLSISSSTTSQSSEEEIAKAKETITAALAVGIFQLLKPQKDATYSAL